MGADPARGRALTRHATDRRPFPLELSLASFFSFDSRNLRRRRAANLTRRESESSMAGVNDPGYNGDCPGCFDSHCDVGLPNGRLLRLSVDMDLSRPRRALVLFGIFFTRFRISRMDTSGDHIFRAPCDVSVHPAKLRRSQIQSLARVAQTLTARSTPPLSQHLSMGGVHVSFGKKTPTGRTNRAPREHINVGWLTFHQRLQPNPSRWCGARIRDHDSRRD